MKLYKCDKDGFNAEMVYENKSILASSSNALPFITIPMLYDPSIKIVSINLNNPDGTAQIKVEIDDPECDHLLTDYYYIQ